MTRAISNALPYALAWLIAEEVHHIILSNAEWVGPNDLTSLALLAAACDCTLTLVSEGSTRPGTADVVNAWASDPISPEEFLAGVETMPKPPLYLNSG